MLTDIFTWIGILFCISQSAMFSGLNLAIFSISRLQLEVDVSSGNPAAKKVLALRQDANFALTTILWGNVGINVLLTLLSDSVLTGIGAFLFSTVIITLFGEIAPQAYFSRHALRIAALLAPLLRFYQVLLYPVAKPAAMLLDLWLGPEGIQYFRERDLRAVIHHHMEAEEADVDRIEGMGALNFLAIDDVPVVHIGTLVDPRSIVVLPEIEGRLQLPKIIAGPDDPFLQQINAAERKWVILTNPSREPRLVMDADSYLRDALLSAQHTNPYAFCHRPIIVRDSLTPMGDLLSEFKVDTHSDDEVIDKDIILVWGENPMIVTGADILGRLLRGIVTRMP